MLKRSALIVVLAGLLSGCVTAGEQYASSSSRTTQASHPRHAVTVAHAVRPALVRQSQVILGAAY